MGEPFRYDRVIKDIFLHDHPSLLARLTGGRRIVEFGNVELPRTMERRADLVVLLEGRVVHHMEFQGQNWSNLAYRQGIDCFLLAERFKGRRIEQSVVYFGEAPMRMRSGIDVGAGQVQYELMDIRSVPVREFLQVGGPGDLVLATLANGGKESLTAILQRICTLPGEQRSRALTQAAVLSGLRSMTSEFRMEMKRMGLTVDIKKNEVLRPYFEEAEARGVEKGLERGLKQGLERGLEQGREQGMEQGAADTLRVVLQARFGELPEWVEDRLRQGGVEQMRHWTRKAVSAPSLESVLGKP